ncbi:hypothetical protein [Streptomyces uncialis]|uniref:hypothetical protein n=1 Tax=Streptomyces uncialis TaxID=1048205 RepID=UPI000AE85108|nr:hypothetical protein [Streptomyces uncialis]
MEPMCAAVTTIRSTTAVATARQNTRAFLKGLVDCGRRGRAAPAARAGAGGF